MTILKTEAFSWRENGSNRRRKCTEAIYPNQDKWPLSVDSNLEDYNLRILVNFSKDISWNTFLGSARVSGSTRDEDTLDFSKSCFSDHLFDSCLPPLSL